MIKVLVEQPMASPGAAKYSTIYQVLQLHYILTHKRDHGVANHVFASV